MNYESIEEELAESYSREEKLEKENKILQKLLNIEKNKREQFDEDNQILHSIIKEVREYIERNKQKTIPAYGDNFDDDFDIALDEEDIDNILEILEKENKE